MEMEMRRTSNMAQSETIKINSLQDLLNLSESARPTTMAKAGQLIISKSKHDECWQIEIIDDWR
jgi:hypothetical protein